tara:strand:- start:37669 stop:39033 length:1365 start_codon:yes stop_codon:yes gene_type:complete
MPFIPHTEEEVSEMLRVIGVPEMESLFSEIPESLKVKQALDLPPGMTEMQISQHARARGNENSLIACYLGAGSYDHFIPACVWDLTSRGEFMTAYTPYQAEASQGNLQLLWEYQTMMASLMGLPVSNASLYDGASALAESVLMALRSRRQKSMSVWVPMALHPHYRQTLEAILKPQNIALVEIPYHLETGLLNTSALEAELKQGTACDVLIVSQPNFFGGLETVDELTDWAHKQSAMVIGHVNPMAMNLLKPPGEWGQKGADIACGEGQPLGVPMNFGGPYFGFMCCQQALIRQMPGRLVGRTIDHTGQPGFTLTLQAREQHIRRGKATSNICTNQGLLVTAATIYMSVMGPEGLKRVAYQSYKQAEKLYEKLLAVNGISAVFECARFHEFVIRVKTPPKQVVEKMQEASIQAGVALCDYYAELDNTLLVCVTETKTDEMLDHYVDTIDQLLNA